ncbi:hypothetical protein ABZ318_17985 [Streptomyces sp. NPDC006197]|uniref:hypothetical protein n=1 Tax=Streptomyces sp. NPDC006197 TaxID=3156685 RepID=UPI0033BEFDEA
MVTRRGHAHSPHHLACQRAAAEVLLEINDDPTHLFGYTGNNGKTGPISHVPQRLNAFRDHLNELFSTDEGPFVPVPLPTGPPAERGQIAGATGGTVQPLRQPPP